MPKQLTAFLGLFNVMLLATALLIAAVSEGRAATEDPSQGCWREREISIMLPPETYCCSWLVCDCGLLEFGECIAA